MKDSGADPVIQKAVVLYARKQGGRTMSDVLQNMDAEEHHRTMAQAQDKIGWRRLMEGMIFQSMVISQDIYRAQRDKG